MARRKEEQQEKDSKEKRSTRARAPERKGSKSNNAVIRYFQDTGEELRKVTWPTREETIRLSMIVIGATLVSTLVMGLLDVLFQELMALFV